MSHPQLIDIQMNDGSRHFGSLPEIYPWDFLREGIKKLDGATETAYISGNVVEFWLDFTFRGYKFSVNNQFGEFWFFVEGVSCPDSILQEILEHFRKLYK